MGCKKRHGLLNYKILKKLEVELSVKDDVLFSNVTRMKEKILRHTINNIIE